MDAQNSKALHDVSAPHKGPNIDVYCRLFYDIVPMNVCFLRKKELDTFGWNTCSGCTVRLLQQWAKDGEGQ